MKQTLEKREPVEWTRKKKYPNTQKLKIVDDENIKRISELEQENEKLKAKIDVMTGSFKRISGLINENFEKLSDIYSTVEYVVGGYIDDCEV